jgi:hypothetical protein
MTKPTIVNALMEVRKGNESGLLVPDEVVTAATDPQNPLHECFEWDDAKASHAYRVWQARVLIARVRIVRDEQTEKAIPMFVSIMRDRAEEGGGYRTLESVLLDQTLYGELLATALSELRAFQERYASFKELKPVFAAIGEVVKTTKPKRRKVVAA